MQRDKQKPTLKEYLSNILQEVFFLNQDVLQMDTGDYSIEKNNAILINLFTIKKDLFSFLQSIHRSLSLEAKIKLSFDYFFDHNKFNQFVIPIFEPSKKHYNEIKACSLIYKHISKIIEIQQEITSDVLGKGFQKRFHIFLSSYINLLLHYVNSMPYKTNDFLSTHEIKEIIKKNIYIIKEKTNEINITALNISETYTSKTKIEDIFHIFLAIIGSAYEIISITIADTNMGINLIFDINVLDSLNTENIDLDLLNIEYKIKQSCDEYINSINISMFIH